MDCAITTGYYAMTTLASASSEDLSVFSADSESNTFSYLQDCTHFNVQMEPHNHARADEQSTRCGQWKFTFIVGVTSPSHWI